MSQSTAVADITVNPLDPTSVTPSGRRLGFLDALRGIAALAVCLEHLGGQVYPAFASFTHNWLDLGAFGVTAFFLISGFIIPASIEKHGSLLHFWRGRIFRLYPMYLCAVAAALLCMYFGKIPPFQSSHPLAFIAANATMMQEYLGFGDILRVSWTLGLEMVFYVLCSIAFFFGWLRSPRTLMVVSISIIALASTAGLLLHHAIPMGRLGLLATCFFGTLVYRVYKEHTTAKALWLVLPLWIFFLEGFWLRFHVYPERDAQGVQIWHFTNVAISWGAAYVLFLSLYALRRVEIPYVLQWLGKISYSFYLLADLVRYFIPIHQPAGLWILECIAATILVSALTYHWIERPTMLLGSPSPRPLVAAA